MTRRPHKTIEEQIAYAEERAARALADANEASENCKLHRAGNLYQKAQVWLDRANELRGDN